MDCHGQQSLKGIVTLSDQAIVSAVNFLTGVIIARTCSKEGFGLYTLGFSIMLFVVNMQGALIPPLTWFTAHGFPAWNWRSILQTLCFTISACLPWP